MLTTIQELEREIDQFHKNIKDSNELMKILKSVASLTKTQTESFEVRTKALQDELSKLPPELSDLFQKKIEGFVQEVRNEHQSYQIAVTNLMESYATRVSDVTGAITKVPENLNAQLQKDRAEHIAGLRQIQEHYAADLARTSEKVLAAEASISKIPGALETQAEVAHCRHMDELAKAEAAYSQSLTSSMESYAARIAVVTGAITKVPENLDAQLQKDRAEHIAGLKQIQEHYAADLARTNEAFAKQLQAVVESIQAVPGQIKDNSDQQYSAFLKELEKMMDDRLAQLSNTEKQVVDLSQQLEAKYDAFVAKLEATNMDQLYKYCQDMNKSINTKLGIALGGVAIAVIVSIISLFI